MGTCVLQSGFAADELRQRIIEKWGRLRQRVIDDAIWHRSLLICHKKLKRFTAVLAETKQF